MTDTSYDQSGAARQALLEIYRDYGTAGLDNDVVVNQLLPDLLPSSPREASVVRAAASVGVAGLLNARFAAHMPVDAAVRDVATLMMQRHALDQFACLWIVTEYSIVLGHPLAVPSVSAVPATPVSSAPPAPPAPLASATQIDSGYGTPSAYGQPAPSAFPATATPMAAPAPYTPTAPPTTPYAPSYGQTSTPPYAPTSNPPYTPGQAAPGQPSQPSYAPTTAFPAQTPGGFTPATPGGYAPPSYPQYGAPSYGTTPPKSKAPLIIALVVVALLLVGGGIIVVALSGKKTPHAGPSTPASVPVTTPPTTPITTPPPSPTVEALEALLPRDIDATADCSEDPTADLPDNGVGIIKNFSCTEPTDSSLAGAKVFAYQMKDSASFDATWTALNKQLIFDPTDSKLATRCPSSSSAGGLTTWHKGDGPTLGQLECWGADSGGYVYMWGWKDNQAIFIVHGESTQSRDAVDQWWQNES